MVVSVRFKKSIEYKIYWKHLFNKELVHSTNSAW